MSRVKHFIHQPEWYAQKGIPYSLKILLHGPPGCGKTSIIKAVANYTRRHIKEIPLQRVKSRQALMEIMHNPRIGFKVVKPRDCIFVFEEFDKMGSVVEEVSKEEKKESPLTQDTIKKVLNKVVQEETQTVKRDEYTKKGTPPLSLGDMLNVMDGLLETDGMLIFMTANNIDTLNKAIMRPGRVDMKLKFEKCSTASVKKIIKAAYDIPTDQNCQELDTIDDDDERFQKKWTPAEIQELCMQEKNTSDVISLLENEICIDCDAI
jgi:chaperone BCS1